MITALIFIIVIGVLVFVHEFGHFVFAKRAGMKVEEFGFGFPPRIWGLKRGETVYSINLIPFGGFVKILGEEGESRNDPRSFSSKPAGVRLKVIVAGVAMNFLLAIFLLMLGNFFGLRIGLIDDKTISIAKDKQVQVIEISNGSPADIAGFKLLDEIEGLKVSNYTVEVANIEDVQTFVRENSGQAIQAFTNRGGEAITLNVIPRANPPIGEGALGVSLALTGLVSYSWFDAIWRGVYDAVILTINTIIGYFMLFKTLLLKGRLVAEVSGPIGIANLTGQAARIGFNYLMQFTAMISINLAVLNIIPFPALDGGRAVMIIVEKLKGSPVNKKIEQFVNATGFALLIALMVYVTVKDLGRFF